MDSLTGSKIFVLYPDKKIRDIFYGMLRNRYEVYFIYDYEKIGPLSSYYPGSIVVLNLVDNDLEWLPEELNEELKDLQDAYQPKMIAFHDRKQPPVDVCRYAVHYKGDKENSREELNQLFSELGAKGRRNFVRYGGSDDNIAGLRIVTDDTALTGIVHDISASGLSCSVEEGEGLVLGKQLKIQLSLKDKTVDLNAKKILERNFKGPVHVLKFDEPMPEASLEALLHFIYNSLDSKMQEFIKNLSN